MERFPLIVIGGGQSGLATAHAAARMGVRALVLEAAAVTAATGGFSRPHRPDLPGLADFTGRVLHSAEYRTPEPFADQRIVVVGGGNSAVQIAVELAGTARVSLATRAPLSFLPQRPLGRDLHWWLVRSGLDAAPIMRLPRSGATPVLDDGRYRAALASGNPDRRPLFARLRRGVIELDPLGYTLRVAGRLVDLSPREFELLRHLLEHAGRVVSRNQLWREVWRKTTPMANNTITVHIRRLRNKLGESEINPRFVHTVRGLGYRLDPEG